MFGLLSTQPKYNEIIKPFIALAPVYTVGFIESPVKYLAYNWPLLEFLKLKGGPFLQSSNATKYFEEELCPRFAGRVCADIVALACGFDGEQLNRTRLEVYLAHTPAGTSIQNILHWAQMVRSKKSSMFDYGRTLNLERYGEIAPPEYEIESITNEHIALFSSRNDWLADSADVQLLKSRLKVPLLQDYIVPFEKWNHIDFIWGEQAAQYVNEPLIKLLDKF